MEAHPGLETASADSQALDLERLVRNGLIDTYFTPVVDLDTGAVIGHRVYHGSSERPVGVGRDGSGPTVDTRQFAAMRRAVRDSALVGDLDSSLRSQALREAERIRLPRANRLFITAEPQSLGTVEDRTAEPDRSAILQLHPDRIAQAPAMTLRSVRQARTLGWGIGMTAIGKEIRTTAFLPLVNPSVVTLHPEVLRTDDDRLLADLIRLLHAHVERTGAILVADGMDHEDDFRRARALGARFGTGPLFGVPARTPTTADPAGGDVLADHYSRNLLAQGTPFTIAQGLGRDPLIMEWSLLNAQMRSLEERSQGSGESAVVIGVFGDLDALHEETVARYARISDTAGYSVMLSAGFDTPPVAAARGGQIDTSDPLQEEFCAIVIGPDWSGLTVGKRRYSPGPDGRTEYDVHVTTDRYACVDAARAVLSRIRTLH